MSILEPIYAGFSDHVPLQAIICSRLIERFIKKFFLKVLDIAKSEFVRFKAEISKFRFLHNCPVDQLFEIIEMFEESKKFLKYKFVNKDSRYWFTKCVKKCRNQINLIYRRFVKNPTEENKLLLSIAYDQYRLKLKTEKIRK